MAIVSGNNSADRKGIPWFGGIVGLAVGLTMLYYWSEWTHWWPGNLPEEMSPYMLVKGIDLGEVPLHAYGKLLLFGFLLVFLFPGYGKLPIAAWMLHNQPSGGTFFNWILRAWGVKCGVLVLVFCNLFFLRYVPSTALSLYSFILQHVSILASVVLGGLLVGDACRLARSADAPLSDLRLLMVLILGFQLHWPMQITLLNARNFDSLPAGWAITAALMIGVLLAFLLTAILAWGVCRMLGDENCRAWRGQFALFNGMIILCVTGKGVFGLVSYYLK